MVGAKIKFGEIGENKRILEQTPNLNETLKLEIEATYHVQI